MMSAMKAKWVSITLVFLLLATAVAAQVQGPRYVELEPNFTLNYGDMVGGRLRYLQTAITLQVADNAAALEVNAHADALRHAIIMHMTAQDHETVRTNQGRETIQEELLFELRRIMEQETGEPKIERVLFTFFVIQG
ncbi:MAG: flagellar basal body-associated FliL family protein [Saccharospirillum sp.]|nr:flagellar basal body-associated FliL family protein [Saccharospirillum sp.]